MIRIGIIRERKDPPDTRVPLTPKQCKAFVEKHEDISIVVEASPDRCFEDEEYVAEGIQLVEDLTGCDVLLGVKEVPINNLIEGKTYFFFSHTKKKQPYNKPLMQALISKGISMVDYECLTYDDGQRILGFGEYAGIVGTHNALLTYGKKFDEYNLPRATEVEDFQHLVEAYQDVSLPAVKIAITGSGRVPQGAMNLLNSIGVKEVSPQEYLTNEYNYPVYTLLKDEELYARKNDDGFERQEFYTHPELYSCLYPQYITQTDILVNGIYWEKTIAKLFKKEDIQKDSWRTSVIADVTCDINGSVPINIGATTIAEPVYGILKKNFQKAAPFQSTKDVIDVMAVDNLPNELPRGASRHFGEVLTEKVLPELLKGSSSIIDRATICKNGKLNKGYEYLSDYAYN